MRDSLGESTLLTARDGEGKLEWPQDRLEEEQERQRATESLLQDCKCVAPCFWDLSKINAQTATRDPT